MPSAQKLLGDPGREGSERSKAHSSICELKWIRMKNRPNKTKVHIIIN